MGQAYYSSWYLSRELQKLGWIADLVNFEENPANEAYYHGEDIRFSSRSVQGVLYQWLFFIYAIAFYEIVVFANTHNMRFGLAVSRWLSIFGEGADVRLLRLFGKKIVYAHNGCLDGVSQTSFSNWKPYKVCSSCVWRERPDVCSDERNLSWGKLRNSLADHQFLLGGNRADYNLGPRIHETPWFYCLDKSFWRPDLLIPSNYILPVRDSAVRLYHSVGNFDSRSHGEAGVETIKSTHIYLPVIERLKGEGYDVEMIFFTDVPNKIVRYYQAQADVFLEMLTYGWFGANAREAMMLGKPVICYLRPEWLESARLEIPEYVNELPVVSATPHTVYDVLKDLIENPEKRLQIGRKSRAFAEKWHASDRAAAHFDGLFTGLLGRGPEGQAL